MNRPRLDFWNPRSDGLSPVSSGAPFSKARGFGPIEIALDVMAFIRQRPKNEMAVAAVATTPAVFSQ